MTEEWRSLRVGDRVRVVRLPTTLGYELHPETVWLYRQLIARGRSLRVFEIDEWGSPWIQCRFPLPDGEVCADGKWAWHFLAINDDSWVRVRHRRRP